MNLQGLTTNEAVTLLKSKSNWNNSDVITIISSLKKKTAKLADSNSLKIGDIHNVASIGHPAVIIAIRENKIYSVTLTTEETFAGIIRKCNSRWLQNNFFTNTIVTSDREIVVNNITGIYENKRDLTEIKKLLKQEYYKLFK